MFIFLFINKKKELEESSIEKENDLIDDDDLLWESYYSEIDQFEDN